MRCLRYFQNKKINSCVSLIKIFKREKEYKIDIIQASIRTTGEIDWNFNISHIHAHYIHASTIFQLNFSDMENRIYLGNIDKIRGVRIVPQYINISTKNFCLFLSRLFIRKYF